MKHITDFESYQWHQLETKADAEADQEQTGHLGAAPFWELTGNGSTFFVLKGNDGRTHMTSVVYPRGDLIQSKVNVPAGPDFHHEAVLALASTLGTVKKSHISGDTRSPAREGISTEDIEIVPSPRP